MKALLIDVGNTRTVVAAWHGCENCPALAGDSGQLAALPPLDLVGEFPTPKEHQAVQRLRQSLEKLAATQGNPSLFLVSVVPMVTAGLANELSALVVLDHQSPLPFVMGVESPEAVGPDRLANMAAACGAGLSSALVVDCGTATTFDLLWEGTFAGGLIAPGPALSARALGQEAAMLPAVPFQPAPPGVGTSTEAAMIGGSWWVGIQGVKGVVGDLLDQYAGMPVIITGGLGRHFQHPDWHHDSSWTLRGIAVLGGLCSA